MVNVRLYMVTVQVELHCCPLLSVAMSLFLRSQQPQTVEIKGCAGEQALIIGQFVQPLLVSLCAYSRCGERGTVKPVESSLWMN